MVESSSPASMMRGTSAGRWGYRSDLFRIAALGFFLLGVLIESLTAAVPLWLDLTLVIIVPVLCILGAIVTARLLSAQHVRELREGYSTAYDLPGYDLLHPVTGALIRPWNRTIIPRPWWHIVREWPAVWERRYPAGDVPRGE